MSRRTRRCACPTPTAETVADELRDAHAEGRLTLEEFEERLDRALSAKTWAASVISDGDFHGFWPIWVIVPGATVLLRRTLHVGAERERPGRQDGERDRL